MTALTFAVLGAGMLIAWAIVVGAILGASTPRRSDGFTSLLLVAILYGGLASVAYSVGVALGWWVP
jgi:dipeptide/tripeptide permease